MYLENLNISFMLTYSTYLYDDNINDINLNLSLLEWIYIR